MAKIPILDKKSIDKLLSLIRESHSVSEGINDEAISTESTFSSFKIKEDLKALEDSTEQKINQSIKTALGSEKEVNDAINSWFE